MSVRRIDVFFYGLFMDEALLRAKGTDPSDPRVACLPGFALRIGQRGTLLPDPASSVYGVVFALPVTEVAGLYASDGFTDYKAEAVLVQLAGGPFTPALCFNLITPPGPDEANPEYAEKLRALSARLGLPGAYVAGIA